jgi:hypothetical protein
MKNYLFILVIIASIIVISCGDEHQFFTRYDKTEAEGIRVRFVHAASDTVALNMFVNEVKISGGAPSTIAATGAVNVGRIAYAGDFPATGYMLLGDGPGTSDIDLIIPEVYTSTDTFPTKVLSSITTDLGASNSYTVALVGVTTAYETVVFEDNLESAPLDGKAYIRFANFIDNMGTDELKLVGTPPATVADPTPAPIDLITDISYKEMSGFIALPRTGVYTNIQLVNETTAAVVYTLTPANSALYTYTDNRVYTLFARGRIGGAGAAAPNLGRMLNR